MSRLFQSFARPPAVLQAPMLAVPARATDDAHDDANGPGWYESSLDLRRGLVVQELVDPDDAREALALPC